MTDTGVEQEYAGQSLRFVRRLLRAEPKWACARDAAHELPLRTEDEPCMFAVVFFESFPHGNCGVYVGRREALTYDRLGYPALYHLKDEALWGGRMVGWIGQETFVLASRTPPP